MPPNQTTKTMSKKYTIPETEPQMVNEPAVASGVMQGYGCNDIASNYKSSQETTMQAICLMFTTLDYASQIEVEHRLAAMHSAVRNNEQLRSAFQAHLKAWEDETILQSSSTIIRSNEHFKAIVAMGKDIVPFILEELRKEPSHLNWVLTEIYGAPVTDHPVTNAEACRLWIEKLSA